MGTGKRRSAAFFIQYAVLLLCALLWVQFPYVGRHTGERVVLFYALIAIALCYVALRAYLVLAREVSRRWELVWLAVDLVIISLAVELTGRIDSEAALLYFWPIATHSIRRRPRMTMVTGLVSAVLYVAATRPENLDATLMLATRLFVLLLVTLLAAWYSLMERARVEEIAALRERAILADYRMRLSREMHDGIQHYLTTLNARLQLARGLLPSDPARAAAMAVDQQFTIRQASDELRSLVRRLRSPAIEQRGFVEALRDHLAMFAQRSEMAAPLEIEGAATPLPPDLEQAALRVVQEALTNAEKYAQAGEVKVRVRFGADVFECAIADDGVGFDAADLPARPGLEGGIGMPSMRERAASLGGHLEVVSARGEGTEITLTVPMEGPDTAAQERTGDGEDQTADR